MNHKDHIKAILKDVFRGKLTGKESLEDYLNRASDQILSYVPGPLTKKEQDTR